MRLDKFLADRYGSRTKAAAAIAKGLVILNGKVASPSTEYNGGVLEISESEENYVSLGGFKLAEALKKFNLCVRDKVVADIGASTGGFTDCLLKNGARKVYCIDVGENQLDKSLICDKTVIIDNFNARNLNRELFAEKLDGIVIDVSFISLTYILKAVSLVLGDGAFVVALIKPQFECESRNIGKNGIVRDSATHERILFKVLDFAVECGLNPQNLTNAPIIAGKNMEYLVLLQKNGINKYGKILIKSVKL